MAITTRKLPLASASVLALAASISWGCPIPSVLTSVAESDVVVVATVISYTGWRDVAARPDSKSTGCLKAPGT